MIFYNRNFKILISRYDFWNAVTDQRLELESFATRYTQRHRCGIKKKLYNPKIRANFRGGKEGFFLTYRPSDSVEMFVYSKWPQTFIYLHLLT